MTAVDTNVIISLWQSDQTLQTEAQDALEQAAAAGGICIAPIVYAELLGEPGRTEEFLKNFLQDTEIAVDWDFDPEVWRVAGLRYQAYVNRRRSHRDPGPRRIIADFVIGAHALHRGFALLTFDSRLYRASFPDLHLVC